MNMSHCDVNSVWFCELITPLPYCDCSTLVRRCSWAAGTARWWR